MIGLIEHEKWRPENVREAALQQLYGSSSDAFQNHRQRLAQLSSIMDGFENLDFQTWSCLKTALYANDWQNNCAELAIANGIFPNSNSPLTYFEYELLQDESGKLRQEATKYENLDACETFSGKMNARNAKGVAYPKMAWDGDSQNAVPVAEMHNKIQDNDRIRIIEAQTALDELIKNKINPAFERLTAQVLDKIVTEFWSFEGDFIHQLVDCVILGPYAAADMVPALSLSSGRISVPQYHRGSASSREIQYDLQTQGSPTRKKLMKAVIALLSDTSDRRIQSKALDIIQRIKQVYSVKSNLYCTCLNQQEPSLECCLPGLNNPMHATLKGFAKTFSASSRVKQLLNFTEEFNRELMDEAIEYDVLRNIWYDQDTVADWTVSETDRVEMANMYAFDYSEPVREYSLNEVPKIINKTLWRSCMESLDSVFFTMPLLVESDGGLRVDADTIFDPLEVADSDATKYMHGMERAIERILEKAKLRSPTYWSHVHRYMPSDSVWCEEHVMRPVPPKRRATHPAQWNGMNFTKDAFASPNADEVLYVGRLGSVCVCGWGYSNATCFVPAALCATAQASSVRWAEICRAGSYSTRSDAMLVRRVLFANGSYPPGCEEMTPSTVWGMLDTAQQMDWYAGSSAPWNVSLHEIAAHGPAGVRLGMLVTDSPLTSMPAASQPDLTSTFNDQFQHTIAQPVCQSTRDRLFVENLTQHFRDVLFPMAHAVHETPSQVICGRWVIEYALFVAMQKISGPTALDVEEQRGVEERWRTRCKYQLEIVGMCALRDVYSFVPRDRQDLSHCNFTMAPGACVKFFVTDTCLLMCDGKLYDPCMCGADQCRTVFSKDACATSLRSVLSSPELQMSSLHWPQTVWPANPANQAKLDSTLNALKQNTDRVTFEEGFFDFVRRQAGHDDGDAPDAFCDDLIDYMDPSAQHPVGYHPTCACDRRETNMRGFDAWMSSSKDSEHAYSIDPVRLRNMSMYSTTFGAAHLTCDALAYMSHGARLNSLHMQSKWNPKARADASMPVLPDFSSEEGMTSFGTPSYDEHDTPLQTDEHANDLFRHSVGLIRDWLRDYDNVSDQSVLDELWPHWLDTGTTDTFAAPSEAELAGKCQLPPLLQCFQDSDCIFADAQLRCRKNQNGPDSNQMGICVRVDTCYQHAHCPDDKLCSGTGFCETPEIVIYNSLGEDISAQIFARDSKKCLLSSFGVSAFQNAPTFARDNGLCGVHELFNYRNATRIAEVSQTHPYITSVRSRMTQRIPDPVTTFRSMTDLNNEDAYNILKMLAHPCDRDYEHSDFGICTPESFETFIESDASVSKSRSTRTWKKKNEITYLDFCNLQVGGGFFGALTSPYMHYDENSQPVDTLKHTKTTIKKCDDYKFCPSTVYTVRGEKVDRFVFDVANGERQRLRLYRTYDAQMCMSFGVWDDIEKRCYVDHFIVPIFNVLFTDSNVDANGNDKLQTQQLHFQTLQTECPDAFGKESSAAFRAFQNTYDRLTSPYEPWNENENYDAVICESQNGASTHNSFCVMQTINKLTLRIFNVDTNHVGGISDMDTYKIQGRCTTYIYRKLQKVRDKTQATFEAGNTIIPAGHIPGSTLYMFSGHFPVEVPLSWIWKCVLIASEQDGGAPQNWFTAITDAEETYELQCPNMETNPNRDSTLLRHLQLQPDIYESKTQSNLDTDVYEEMLEIMETAVDFWSVVPVPIVQCRKLNNIDPSICDVQQYADEDFQCWNRVILPNLQDISEQKKTVMPCEDSDSKCTIYDVALKILFGKNRKELEDMNSITINWLKQEGLARELTLAYEFTSNFNYEDTIPEFELTNLQFLNESVIYNANADAYSTSAQQVACPRDTFVLSSPEYEISTAIHDCALKQTSELCIYTKIFNIHEVYSALVGDNIRISNEISRGYGIQNRILTVAISQKQMLLLMLYFLREVMYLGSSSKFGTMRYNTDARRFMLADLDIAKKLASRLEEVKTYNHVLKKNNFYCPDDKLFADVNPSELQFQLRRCLDDLKLNTGWNIPAGKKVMLQADRDMFLNAFYVSFLVRDTQTQFLDELIITDWHELQYSHRTRRLCFDTPEGAAHLFPLWSGELDLQSCPHGDSCGCQMSTEGFDTFVDLTCDNSQSMESCAGNFPLFYDNVKRAMYDNCWSEQGRVVSVAQYEQMKPGNLCSRKPQSETCNVAFGSQGRVQGKAAVDLHKISEIKSTQAGLFDPDNTLFRAESSPDPTEVTAMQLLSSDIGGHSMAFMVKEIGSFKLKSVVMDLTCVSAGVSCKSTHPTNWLRNIRSAWSVQHNLYVRNSNLNRDSANGQGNTPWHCPLQWLSAHSDSTTKYAARSPSAERNRIRFGHITGAKTYAHATVVQTMFATQHPARFMSDNRACVDGVLDIDSMRFDCRGKQHLLGALLMHNGKWSTAKFVNQKVEICMKLLDWPHLHYGTVDGNRSKTTEVPRYCNVFWRLPSFALRYAKRLDTDVDKYSWKPTHKDGVCHMGRLRKSTLQETDINQFCTATDTHMRCRMLQRNASITDATKYSWYEQYFNFEAPFRATKRPALRNRKCSRCDRHDTASIVDRRHRETALRDRIKHLSVGQPIVVSTERLIAATLRRHACPNPHNESCLKMYDAINASSWTRTRFLDALLESASEYQRKNDIVASDDELWSIPWVLCQKQLTQDVPIQSKASCKGSITKQEWRNVNTRFSACRRESTPLISEKKSILNLCLLSEQTGELCRNISDWNAAIMNILCIVGKHPDCTSRAFYYNPSQYSLSNKDFVYNSIQNFYTKLDNISCPIKKYVPGIENRDLLESCQSIAIAPFVEMLKMLRQAIRSISMVLYYGIQVFMNLVAVFCISVTRASIYTVEIQYYLDFFTENLKLYSGLLLNKINEALKLIWPIMWDFMNYGQLNFFRIMAESICLSLKYIIVPIVKEFILPMVIFFEDLVIQAASALCKIGFGNLCDETPPKSDTRIQLENFNISCEYYSSGIKSKYKKILPMPTRCWSTYNTFYGDSSMLSCRASDTCYKSITDTTLVKCSMCEKPFQDYEMFGCSEITQTCTCNLPTFTEQECISNEECFNSDSVCRFLDGELEPSIGFTRCENCQTKRFCLLTSGRSTGYCACGLLNVEFARCVQRGEAVIPGYNQLCIYTQDYNYLKTTEYIFSFYTTMSVPCVALNPAFTTCAMEGNDNELYIVGTQAVRRRHLLEIESRAEMTAQDTHNSLCQDALSSEHMPAYKNLCIEAFHGSMQTLRELGLQSTLPPCSFCSKEDAIQTFLLHPNNLFVVVTNISRMLHIVTKHTMVSGVLKSFQQVRKDVNIVMNIVEKERVLVAEDVNGNFQVRAVVDDERVKLLANIANFILTFIPQKSNTTRTHSGNWTGRKLLSIDDIAQSLERNFEMSAELRRAFEAQLTSAFDFSFETETQKIAWPNSWPPKVGLETLQGNSCPPLTNMLRNTDVAFKHIGSAYSKKTQMTPVSSIQESWIKVDRHSDVNISWADYDALLVSEGVITGTVLWFVDYVMSLLQASPNFVFDVSASAIQELLMAVQCDFESVQTCSKWRVHFSSALIIVCIYYFILYLLFGAVGLSLPVVAASFLIIPFVFYVSYGYAPLCFPTIPVCLYDDILSSLQLFTPKNIKLPDVWYKSATCASYTTLDKITPCLRKCSDAPFSYLEWYDPLSWWAIEFNFQSGFLQVVKESFVSAILSEESKYDIQTALNFRLQVVDTQNSDLIYTNRICAVLTTYKLLPYLMLVGVLALIVLGTVQALFVVINAIVNSVFLLLLSSFY